MTSYPGFLNFAYEGLKSSCNMSPIRYVLQPAIAIFNPFNFPLFIISNFVLWVCIFFPIITLIRKYRDTTEIKDKSDSLHTFEENLFMSFTMAFLSFTIIYFMVITFSVNCLSVNMDIGAQSAEPIIDALPPSTTLDVSSLSNTWVP